ncbi:hypothetical protein, partial [Providencia sp. CRPN16913]
ILLTTANRRQFSDLSTGLGSILFYLLFFLYSSVFILLILNEKKTERYSKNRNWYSKNRISSAKGTVKIE